MAKFTANAKTKKGQHVEQEGIYQEDKPARHDSGIYHSVMTVHGHENEYAVPSGSLDNPIQHKFPANKYHGGKVIAKRKGSGRL